MIKIGVRGSKLALAYADIVVNRVKTNFKPIVDIQIVPIKTDGDIYAKKNIAEIGGKGVFVTKIEQELLAGNIDLAVHSFKDLPKDLHNDTEICAVMPRHDPRDAMLGKIFSGCKIGTSSPRRKLQLQKLYPDCEILPIRGNIDTRIEKLKQGDYDAIFLAVAGLETLGLEHEITDYMPLHTLVPAVGQGVIAVQSLKNQNTILLEQINHKNTYDCAMAERYMLQEIDGDCDTAVGSITSLIGDVISLEAYNYENNTSVKLQMKSKKYRKLGELAGREIK